jgi:hypothetical protein
MVEAVSLENIVMVVGLPVGFQEHVFLKGEKD